MTGALGLVAGDALIALAPSRIHGALDSDPGDFRWFWPWVGIVTLADVGLALWLGSR